MNKRINATTTQHSNNDEDYDDDDDKNPVGNNDSNSRYIKPIKRLCDVNCKFNEWWSYIKKD
mgnify:CR=1 FL=1